MKQILTHEEPLLLKSGKTELRLNTDAKDVIIFSVKDLSTAYVKDGFAYIALKRNERYTQTLPEPKELSPEHKRLQNIIDGASGIKKEDK